MARLLEELEVHAIGIVCSNLARHIGTHRGECCGSGIIARADDGLLLHMHLQVVDPRSIDKPLDDIPALVHVELPDVL